MGWDGVELGLAFLGVGDSLGCWFDQFDGAVWVEV